MDWNTHPLPSSLCVAPSRLGGDEHKFSLAVARMLTLAHYLLSVSSLSPTYARQASEELRMCRKTSMAAQQHLLLEYLLAWAATQLGDLRAALIHLDNALTLAEQLRDLPAYCELAWRAGVVGQRLGFCVDAHFYLTEALTTSHTLMQRGDACDCQLQLDLHLRLASLNFELALFPAASHHLDEAMKLLRSPSPHGSQAQLQMASLTWIQAQLYRWQGQLDLALGTAIRVADDLVPIAPPITTARMQLVVAEIALDLAEPFSRGPGAPISIAHTSYMDMASTYIQSAEQLTQQAADPIGSMIARLAWHRWQRVGERGLRDVAAIEKVAHEADLLGDMAVVGRAYTALGDEQQARGQREAALSCYRQARDILERQKYLASAIWPRRALLKASEMSSDIPDMQSGSGL